MILRAINLIALVNMKSTIDIRIKQLINKCKCICVVYCVLAAIRPATSIFCLASAFAGKLASRATIYDHCTISLERLVCHVAAASTETSI